MNKEEYLKLINNYNLDNLAEEFNEFVKRQYPSAKERAYDYYGTQYNLNGIVLGEYCYRDYYGVHYYIDFFVSKEEEQLRLELISGVHGKHSITLNSGHKDYEVPNYVPKGILMTGEKIKRKLALLIKPDKRWIDFKSQKEALLESKKEGFVKKITKLSSDEIRFICKNGKEGIISGGKDCVQLFYNNKIDEYKYGYYFYNTSINSSVTDAEENKEVK